MIRQIYRNADNLIRHLPFVPVLANSEFTARVVPVVTTAVKIDMKVGMLGVTDIVAEQLSNGCKKVLIEHNRPKVRDGRYTIGQRERAAINSAVVKFLRWQAEDPIDAKPIMCRIVAREEPGYDMEAITLKLGPRAAILRMIQ